MEEPSDERRSKYSYRHLNQLLQYSMDTPLRVTAHIDLDAFYAQCEMKRLGTDENTPLAVQQWQSLIAVNYPAREFNVSRHSTAADALKLCPQLKLVHVATWRAGDEHWDYRENPDIVTCKACLDPYRNESKKIISVFRAACPRVEKASIDESFLDLSVMIHERLLKRFPVLALPPPYNDPTENLPLPPEDLEINWAGSHLLELAEDREGDGQLDWDDVGMGIAAEIVDEIRASVRRELGYTCSAGIAQNKLLAKLGSGYKKPNQQTVVRVGAAQKFLNSFKFTKLRNLGGKLGEKISEVFGTEELSTLLDTPLQQLQQKLDDDTATWVYNVIRGIDRSEVNPRTLIKSMLSAKSFRPYITTADAASKWLTIFIADIYSRMEEEGVMEGKRRPKTMTLHYRSSSGAAKGRSVPIRDVTKPALTALAQNLLRGVVDDARAWPCAGLSLSVSGFEEREAGNVGIRGFLVSGEAAKERNAPIKPESSGAVEREPKRRRLGEEGIGRFFTKGPAVYDEGANPEDILSEDATMDHEVEEALDNPPSSPPLPPPPAEPATEERPMFQCDRCNASLPFEDQDEHQDWHFAKDLAREDRAEVLKWIAPPPPPAPPTSSSSSSKKPKKGSGGSSSSKKGAGAPEKGQRKLFFGK
ncbi:DNA/RNA polymerase [Choiromyces venosus 120613-1]|uniref:DNA polymerase eta n=1 Tax=Choiromyces venosus 120613-1 TaxID=1336337 RepID=A0A3N4J355_9PEZI|nr:DNA/RNA polymerase [Choiromyces venosus 120613-1]